MDSNKVNIKHSHMFNMLLNNFNGMIYQCYVDDMRVINYLSAGAELLTGYTLEELMQLHDFCYFDLIDSGQQSSIYQKKQEVVHSKQALDIEYRLRQKNGDLIWVNEYCVPVCNANGQVTVLQGYIKDITEFKNTEQSLRDAELRYRSIFENSEEGIFQTSLEGQYLSVNPALAKIYGFENAVKLIAGLQDINNELYVDPNRREQFVNEMNTQGFVRNFESLVYRKDKTHIWISENAHKVYGDTGEFLYYEGTVQDITERKNYENKIEYQSTHDSLTGLPNRYLLNDRLQQNIHHCVRYNAKLAVAFIDIDHFKLINDTMGHDVGDQLLIIMAERITASIRDVDTIARLGGDEFVVLMANINELDTAKQLLDVELVIHRILTAIAQPCVIDDRQYAVTSSIGLSVFPTHGKNAHTLLKNADIALYEAKRTGRNNYQIYNELLGNAQSGRLEMEHNLRLALENKEFLLHYQPKVCFSTDSIIGAEALVRWQPQHGKMIPPIEFIEIAEQSGLIVKIGEWVLREACLQTVDWNQRLGLNMSIAVNVSPAQFKQDSFIAAVESALITSGLAPQLLELEITESLAAQDLVSFINKLNALKKLGVNLAIDDFGTGYSSLTYLKNFPIDCLKIDKSFVSKLEVEPINRAILKAIIVLGQSLNMKVVAEGVETVFQKESLHALGCDIYQGYLFSKPLAEAAFEQLLLEEEIKQKKESVNIRTA